MYLRKDAMQRQRERPLSLLPSGRRKAENSKARTRPTAPPAASSGSVVRASSQKGDTGAFARSSRLSGSSNPPVPPDWKATNSTRSRTRCLFCMPLRPDEVGLKSVQNHLIPQTEGHDRLRWNQNLFLAGCHCSGCADGGTGSRAYNCALASASDCTDHSA